MNHYLAVCAKGLEHLLVEELVQLGINDARPVQAGVMFSATLEQIYRCCLWSRLASRFVRVLAEFKCRDDMDLYLACHAVNWLNHFHSSKTFVVDFNGTNNEIRNSQYGAMKVKDAIVDCFEKRKSLRPSINKDHPDLRIHLRLHKDQALLGIDLVGGGLHQRGYRTKTGVAPLRETLAAAIVLRSGWQAERPLLDPMCGSGTLLIEAAMMAVGIAPGLKRPYWSFQSLLDFDEALWLGIKAEASVQYKRNLKKYTARFYGQDNDERLIQLAKENAHRAGVDTLIEFSTGDATHLIRPLAFEQGVVISNPPYGERLGTHPGLIALYTALGVQLKQHFAQCQVSIFSGSNELLSCLRMRAEKQYKINNGALLCYQKNYLVTQNANSISEQEKSETQLATVAIDFANRLKKNQQKISKWAQKEGLDCYRIYDADLPEYNVAIDYYAGYLVIQEYAAPKTISEEIAKRRVTDIIRATIDVTQISASNIILKTRERQKGQTQYQKLANAAQLLTIKEYNVNLLVNLYDYLDTGLFLDHKQTRRLLGNMAKGKDFLNLFAYTGSATVHAAKGGAKSTTTIDMSNTYLNWAKENMTLNGLVGRQHQYIQADCLQWLENRQQMGITTKEQYDLIFIDPPTFSNSKRMKDSFDVQRDYVQLLTQLRTLLRPEGTIVFSNNKRHFKLDHDALAEANLKAENISERTLPLDFSRNKHIHNCWLITHQS